MLRWHTSVLIGPILLASAWAESHEDDIAPFFAEHCVRCHGPEKQKGDFRLDTLPPDFDSSVNAGVWIEVMDILNLGEMPPDDEPQPAAADHAKVVGWIAGQLHEAQKRAAGGGGRVLLRRLNRTEYANTIRDLLRLPPYLPGEDPTEILPPDATYEGFDKAGSALMLDPSLLDNYFQVAKEIASRVMVEGPPEFPTKTARWEFENTGNSTEFNYLMNNIMLQTTDDALEITGGSTRFWETLNYEGANDPFPVTGNYRIRIRAWADPNGSEEPVKFYLDRINGREPRLLEVEVGEEPQIFELTRSFVALGPIRPQSYFTGGMLNGPSGGRQGIKGHGEMIRAKEAAAQAGDHAKGLRIQARMLAEGYVDFTRPTDVLLNLHKYPKLYLDWVEIEGPLYEAWPPHSHANLLFKGDEAEENETYAREIFTRFLPRAYRRPVEDAEIEKVVGLWKEETNRGVDFQEAIEVCLTYVLTSPSFLYLLEPEESEERRPLDDYELASRLSYFLWSSIPDETLFAAAESGTLRQQLPEQVTRMLADPKSNALVEGFATQWLRTEEYLNFTPDRKIYRGFDPQLQEDMVEETKAFFAEILTNNLSIFNFLDSDFVMVNERLANFYGLDGVKGHEFRRVALPADSPRGGLLGQAGLHLLGSDGIRTKPVTRGVWIREVLFNDPPDPPPPNAGEV
ncbi:MAG: DUF1592 domain-containing protein, partial [Verrucomicrobiota bacterium]